MTDEADLNPGQPVAADLNPGHVMAVDLNPGHLVTAGVQTCLDLARTWHAWDGRPIARATDEGQPNTWTPHKALRRIADHLVDHLHQVEALLAGATPLADEWHGRSVTWTLTGLASPSRATRRRALVAAPRTVVRAAVRNSRGGSVGSAPARVLDTARDRRACGWCELLRRAGRFPGLRAARPGGCRRGACAVGRLCHGCRRAAARWGVCAMGAGGGRAVGAGGRPHGGCPPHTGGCDAGRRVDRRRRRFGASRRGPEFARAPGSATVLNARRAGGVQHTRSGEYADVAQLVEHHLAKVRVAGSNPVVRSEAPDSVRRPLARTVLRMSKAMIPQQGTLALAEWPSGLGKGLQSPVRGFDSRLRLEGG